MATAYPSSVREQSSRAPKPRAACASTVDAIDALESAWSDLDASAASPAEQLPWVRACLAAFGYGTRPHVVSVGQGDHLRGVAALVRKRIHGVQRLCLAGAGELTEPMDMLAADEASRRNLVKAIARGGWPLLLERIAADSPTVAEVQQAYRGRAIVIARPQPTSPFIALDESWLEPEQHLNSGRRSDLRRARRKAEQQGPVSTEIRTPELHELPGLLDTCFEVEARSWKGDEGTSLTQDAQRAVFYRHYCQAAAIAGMLRICLLRIGDHVAAMQLAVEQGGAFWLMKIGYDAEYSHCSPGNLLIRETVRYAAESGLARYEFMGQSARWTEVWTQAEHQHLRVRVYPFGLRGLAALLVDGVEIATRRWRKK